MLSPLGVYKKALKGGTAERWTTGARGGGRGVTFRLKFYQLQEALVADTLWVNGLPLSTEVTQVGDTTYINSFYYTEQVEGKTLANDTAYLGELQLLHKKRKLRLPVSPFTIKATEYHL